MSCCANSANWPHRLARPCGRQADELLCPLTETAFSGLGRVLAALAEAAPGDDLVLTLRQAADGLPAAGSDLAALAATFAALARRGAAERRLALAVLRDIGKYAERRPPRPR